jgi:hypothetical protein
MIAGASDVLPVHFSLKTPHRHLVGRVVDLRFLVVFFLKFSRQC